MRIESLASSSEGNAFLVEDGGTRLLLDAGIRFKRLQELLDFKVSSLDGCLLGHEHLDHSKAIPELIKAGVDIYTSAGTAEALGIEGHRVNIIKSRVPKLIAGVWVVPFTTIHDAAEPLGFVLGKPKDSLLYLTDSAYVEYQFPPVQKMIIECNYDEDLLRENVANGTIDQAHKKRVYGNHMGISRVLKFLDDQDTSRLQEIILCHLSDSNSDEIDFKRQVQEKTGVMVRIANK